MFFFSFFHRAATTASEDIEAYRKKETDLFKQRLKDTISVPYMKKSISNTGWVHASVKVTAADPWNKWCPIMQAHVNKVIPDFATYGGIIEYKEYVYKYDEDEYTPDDIDWGEARPICEVTIESPHL